MMCSPSMTLRCTSLFASMLALVLVLPHTAHADILTPVSGVTDNPNFGGPGATFNVPNLYNGSGLDSTPPDVMDWTAFNENNNWEEWSGHGPLRFDLGDNYDLSTLYVWNYTHSNNLTGRQMQSFDVLVSDDEITWTSAASVSLALDSNVAVQDTQAFALSSANGVRYVMFENFVNNGDGQAGLNEIRFEGTLGAVPEPSTFALAALGLAGLGWFGYRRRQK